MICHTASSDQAATEQGRVHPKAYPEAGPFVEHAHLAYPWNSIPAREAKCHDEHLPAIKISCSQ